MSRNINGTGLQRSSTNNSREIYKSLNRELREADFTHNIKQQIRRQESAKFLKFENNRKVPTKSAKNVLKTNKK